MDAIVSGAGRKLAALKSNPPTQHFTPELARACHILDRTAYATMAAVGEAPTCPAGMAGAAPIFVNVALIAETRRRAKSEGLSNGADV